MKTILFVSHASGFVGSEKFLYDIVTHIDRTQYRILVCCPNWGSQILVNKLEEFQNIKLYKLNYKSAISASKNIFRRIANAVLNLVWGVIFAFIIKKEKVNIVFSNTSWVCVGAIGAKLLQVPHVWLVHENLDSNIRRFIFGTEFYKKFIGWLSYRVMFNSQWTLDQYAHYLAEVSTGIIYNGFEFINKGVFGGDCKKTTFNVTNDLVLGIVGSINSNKGQLKAIRTMNLLRHRLPKCKLIIFGKLNNDEYGNKLREYVKHNNLSEYVVFKGFMDNIQDIYPRIDILLVPSEIEPFGRVVVEGIYYGCIVIAANTGGISGIIQHNVNGVLLNELSPEVIAENVVSVVNNKALVMKIKHNSYQSIKKYSLENTINDLRVLFEEILTRHK